MVHRMISYGLLLFDFQGDNSLKYSLQSKQACMSNISGTVKKRRSLHVDLHTTDLSLGYAELLVGFVTLTTFTRSAHPGISNCS